VVYSFGAKRCSPRRRSPARRWSFALLLLAELRLAEAVTEKSSDAADVNVIWSIGDLGDYWILRECASRAGDCFCPMKSSSPCEWVLEWCCGRYVRFINSGWSNLLAVSHLRGSRVAVINTRSIKRTRLLDGYFRWMFKTSGLLAFLSGECEIGW